MHITITAKQTNNSQKSCLKNATFDGVVKRQLDAGHVSLTCERLTILFKIVGQHNDVVWLPFLHILYTSTADSFIAEKIRVISNEERVADDLNCFIGRFSPIDDAEALAYFAKYKHSDCRLHARDESIFAGYHT